MKLELLSLRAVNCGPLRDVRINFSDAEGRARPIILIAGANGSGKTTVLELIVALWGLMLAVPSTEGLFVDPQFQLPPEARFLTKCEFAKINLLVDEQPLSIFYGRTPDDENLAGDYYGWPARVAFTYTPIQQGRLAHDLYRELKYAKGSVAGITYGSQPTQSTMPAALLYFPYFRAILKVQGSELAKEDTEYHPVYRFIPATAFKGSLEAYLIWLEYAEPDVFGTVQQVIGTLFPKKKSVTIDRRRLKVVVNLPDGGKHDLDELSSGEQNLLTTLIELRRRLTPGSIVLIDEIENSLHPAFQHRIAQGLLKIQREVPFQLVATSHAEAFIDVFGTEATRILPVPNFAIK